MPSPALRPVSSTSMLFTPTHSSTSHLATTAQANGVTPATVMTPNNFFSTNSPNLHPTRWSIRSPDSPTWTKDPLGGTGSNVSSPALHPTTWSTASSGGIYHVVSTLPPPEASLPPASIGGTAMKAPKSESITSTPEALPPSTLPPAANFSSLPEGPSSSQSTTPFMTPSIYPSRWFSHIVSSTSASSPALPPSYPIPSPALLPFDNPTATPRTALYPSLAISTHSFVPSNSNQFVPLASPAMTATTSAAKRIYGVPLHLPPASARPSPVLRPSSSSIIRPSPALLPSSASVASFSSLRAPSFKALRLDDSEQETDVVVLSWGPEEPLLEHEYGEEKDDIDDDEVDEEEDEEDALFMGKPLGLGKVKEGDEDTIKGLLPMSPSQALGQELEPVGEKNVMPDSSKVEPKPTTDDYDLVDRPESTASSHSSEKTKKTGGFAHFLRSFGLGMRKARTPQKHHSKHAQSPTSEKLPEGKGAHVAPSIQIATPTKTKPDSVTAHSPSSGITIRSPHRLGDTLRKKFAKSIDSLSPIAARAASPTHSSSPKSSHLFSTSPTKHLATEKKKEPKTGTFVPLPADTTLTSRERRHQYKHLKNLGRGAQGMVSLRLHTPTGAIVALKAIPDLPDGVAVSGNVREAFRKEVGIMQVASVHPNMIRLLDFWEGKSKVYQVLEVASGGDLESSVAGRPVPEDEAVRLMAPIADALRFLHELGIIHRDVRPANILMRRPLTGRESLQELMTIPVLADFGIATFEKFSGRLGTTFYEPPPHIAPEVLQGHRFTKTSDCFGLGITTLFTLLGRQATLDDQNPAWVPTDPAWGVLSLEAQMFVRGLMTTSASKRMTAKEAVSGAWMRKWGVEVVGPQVEVPHESKAVVHEEKDENPSSAVLEHGERKESDGKGDDGRKVVAYAAVAAGIKEP
ncbi:Calcium/calmodulin-dependent protein kinase type 1 [Chytridiales sp. JEL 0842]|nr:Calcium/calmodulin-dependent protein kinase type 1 [Chytridiales sp. JEL 0842]